LRDVDYKAEVVLFAGLPAKEHIDSPAAVNPKANDCGFQQVSDLEDMGDGHHGCEIIIAHRAAASPGAPNR